MRFALDDAAQTLRTAAAELLRCEVTPAVLRAGWPGESWDLVDAAWGKLAAIGVLGTLVPEEQGGLGLDENSMVPLLEEIGYSGLPVPAVETIAIAAPLLRSSALATAAHALVAVQARAGELIPFGQRAPLIVLIKDEGVWLYAKSELRLEPCDSVDGSRWLARLVAEPEGGVLLTRDAEAVWQRGVLGTAAVLTGLARRMLDMTVEYVKGREQYGVPVGSFQAIKHALANALVAVEFARPMVLAAAEAQAAGRADPGVQTSAAKVLASDAARLVARTAIQCHGAMGYTTEYDLHLFAKRVWALAPSWGSAGWHRARIGEKLCPTS
jgi:alkylation response protein AidB-like acyl-CoA dehydrogenase